METQANPTLIIIETLFKSAGLPLLVAGLSALLFGKLIRLEDKPPFLRSGVTALSAALGFCAGYWALNGFNEFPPVLVQHWSPYFALTACLLLTLSARFGLIAESLTILVLVAGCLFLNLKPLISQWESAALVQNLVPLGVVWMGLLMLWRVAPADDDFPEISLVLVIAMTAASLVNVLDGSASIGQSAGVAAAACGGIFLAGLLAPGLGLGMPFRGTVLVIFGAMLLNGKFFVEVDVPAIILAACVPLAVLVYWVPGVKDGSVWKRGALLCGVALVPLIIAVVRLATMPVESSYY